MKSIIYILEPITNLHVGNGDINYNIIDNEVEKDPINNYPIINSSGVKGAFRQFIQKSDSKDDVNFFGSKAGENGDEKASGMLKFYSGECLGITMRNEVGNSPFSLVTTVAMLKRFIEMSKTMKIKDYPNLKIEDLDENKVYKSSTDEVNVEGIEVNETLAKNSTIINFFTKINSDTANNLVIMPHKLLSKISLPVVARNKLENSISKNLWYEEYVPHHSLFFVCVSCEEDNSLLENFDEAVNNQIIQFGGNATIGYGLTKVVKLFESGDDDEQKKN